MKKNLLKCKIQNKYYIRLKNNNNNNNNFKEKLSKNKLLLNVV